MGLFRGQTQQTHHYLDLFTSVLLFFLPSSLSVMAVRLRNAFRYPEDSGDEREELDEEEQERVISLLQRQNETRNAQYSVGISDSPLPFILSNGARCGLR